MMFWNCFSPRLLEKIATYKRVIDTIGSVQSFPIVTVVLLQFSECNYCHFVCLLTGYRLEHIYKVYYKKVKVLAHGHDQNHFCWTWCTVLYLNGSMTRAKLQLKLVTMPEVLREIELPIWLNILKEQWTGTAINFAMFWSVCFSPK